MVETQLVMISTLVNSMFNSGELTSTHVWVSQHFLFSLCWPSLRFHLLISTWTYFPPHPCYPDAPYYGLFTYIYHEFDSTVGKYTRHGSYVLIHQPKNPIGFQYTYASSSAAAHGMATIWSSLFDATLPYLGSWWLAVGWKGFATYKVGPLPVISRVK